MPKKIYLTGMAFGRLTVIAEHPERASDGDIRWECACECGGRSVVKGASLRSGHTKSCGCHAPRRRHGMSRTPEYWAWKDMRRRCNDASDTHYARYGGRGIRICERWNTFENFFSDMGPRPSRSHSLDRIDNDGHYEPGNVRWATLREQARNKSSNRRVLVDGEVLVHADAAKRLGVSQTTIAVMSKQGRLRSA